MIKHEMTPRERVLAAINFQRPDRVPRFNRISENPLHKLGEAGLQLLAEFPSDRGDPPPSVPVPDPAFVLPDGSWRRVFTSAWGSTLKQTEFGIAGIAIRHPLEDWSQYPNYAFPPSPSWISDDPDVQRERAAVEEKKRRYYCRASSTSTFQTLDAIRGMENVMLDLAAGDERLEELADRVIDRNLASIRRAAAVGMDGILHGDDWGTQNSLLISPRMWRQFFRPRYQKMFDLARELGLDIWFHSDGYIMEILDDLAELGVKVLLPQFSCHDLPALAGVLRRHRIAVQTDIDRQHLIPFGTPAQLREYVRQVIEIFKAREGGLLGHAEFRGSVPLENIRAVFQAWQDFGGETN